MSEDQVDVVREPKTFLTISEDEIYARMDEHELWLASESVRVDGDFIRNVGDGSGIKGKRADFRDLDLRHIDFRDRALSGADFRGACLAGAYLEGVDLRYTDFTGAVLVGADFTRASLWFAIFRDADLTSAGFTRAELHGASFVYADLTRADFTEADVAEVNFTDAIFGATKLSLEDVPVVESLDAKILDAVQAEPDSFDMTQWHGEWFREGDHGPSSRTCGTSHCRAGWAIELAGLAGHALEEKVGPHVAGLLIYLKSTGRIPDFFADAEDALEDIKACAAKEIK